MSALRAAVVVLLAAGLVAGPQSVVCDQPKAEKRETKTDFYGDPLPPGVLARMGSV